MKTSPTYCLLIHHPDPCEGLLSRHLFVSCFFGFFFYLCSAGCGILIPWPGIEPVTHSRGSTVLTTGSPGKGPLTWLCFILLQHWGGNSFHPVLDRRIWGSEVESFVQGSSLWPCPLCLWPFDVVGQSRCQVWLFIAPWTAACQASLYFTVPQSLLKLMSIG